MIAEPDGHMIATARYSSHAVADGPGVWIVSDHPSRLFTRNQEITGGPRSVLRTIGHVLATIGVKL
jgi:hypothetical protein